MDSIKSIFRRASIPLLLLAFLLAAAAGCTMKHLKPEVVSEPTQKFSKVNVGEITVQDKLWETLVPHFRRGLVEGLKSEKAFEEVLDPAPSSLADSSLLLSGKITEIEKGNAALRWIVGFGAGKSKVKGAFEICDCRGTVLAKFEAQESYLGGAGIGGPGFLDMEDLMKRFGETIAQRIVQWTKGEKLAEE